MRRLGMALALAVALVALSVPAVFAKTTDHGSWEMDTGTYPVSGVCPSFTFTQSSHLWVTYSAVTDANGNTKIERHQLEQDTFYPLSGPSFTSDVYRLTFHMEFDSTGNFTEFIATGTILRVTLPDGTLFWSQGRANLLTTTGFGMLVDSGHSGNLDAFCAAMS